MRTLFLKFQIFILLLISFVAVAQRVDLDDLILSYKKEQNPNQQLQILSQISTEMLRVKHPDRIPYLNHLCDVAITLKNYDLAAEKSRFIAQYYTNKNQLDSTLFIVEKMLNYVPKFKKKSSEAHLLLKRASYYYAQEQLKSAILDYDKSGDLFLESGDSIYAADARFFGGQVYLDLNNFMESMKRFETAHKLYQMLGDKEYVSYSLSELVSLYGRNGFHDKAIFEEKKVLLAAKQIKSKDAIAFAYAQLATEYFHKKEFGIMKKYCDSLKIQLEKFEDNRIKLNFEFQYHKLNIIRFLAIENLDKIPYHIASGEQILKEISILPSTKYAFRLYKARYFNKIRKYRQAQAIIEEILEYGSNSLGANLLQKCEKELAISAVHQNKYEKAFQHLSSYNKSKEKEEAKIKQNRFLYFQSLFETQRKDKQLWLKENELKLLEKDNAIAKAKRVSLWTVFLCIVILCILGCIYIWFRAKEKRAVLLKEIDRGKKELEDFTNQLLEKSKIQEQLSNTIKELEQQIGDTSASAQLQELTSTKILTQEDWYIFKEKFVSVYPNFFQRIKNKGYYFTKSEERMVAMEKLDLDNKQIAQMLAISQDSVVRSKSRLRNKISAPKGIPILQFLEIT